MKNPVIACSGLGYVRRGNEAWAQTVAEALQQVGYLVRLVGGGPLPGCRCDYTRIWNIPRDWFAWRPILSWGTRYALEQQTFARSLANHIAKSLPEIVHAADPVLAYRLLLLSRHLGFELVYKDGLLLEHAYWKQFKWVQVLAPHYRDAAHRAGVSVDRCFVIPHMVDLKRFYPRTDTVSARQEILGPDIPEQAIVILAVGDFAPGSNKRLEWIIDEVSRLETHRPVHLLLAGQASATDIARVRRQCQILGNRVHLRPNTPADTMAHLYRAADVMAHAALREPFGIVLLEAMACGVPVIGHSGHAVTEWIIGNGGCTVDMTVPGHLSSTLQKWNNDPKLRFDLGILARQRVEEHFSPENVVPLYRQLYSAIRG